MKKHAEVQVGGFIVPLIGIPVSATEEKCDRCAGIFPITKVEVAPDGKMVCHICLDTYYRGCHT